MRSVLSSITRPAVTRLFLSLDEKSLLFWYFGSVITVLTHSTHFNPLNIVCFFLRTGDLLVRGMVQPSPWPSEPPQQGHQECGQNWTQLISFFFFFPVHLHACHLLRDRMQHIDAVLTLSSRELELSWKGPKCTWQHTDFSHLKFVHEF